MPYFNRRPIEELLQSTPAEVMSLFRVDMRRYTSTIDGTIGLLKDESLPQVHDQLIEIIRESVMTLRDEYDYMLTYLEKLQESRKGDQ